MFKYLNKRRQKGQSTVEYAILIIIVLGALLTIQTYIKRGIQGRLKEATDDIGYQFKPGDTYVNTEITTKSATQDEFEAGVTSSKLINAEVTTEHTNRFLRNINQDFWGTL